MTIGSMKSSVNNAAALLTPKNLTRSSPATMITTKADLAAEKQTHDDFANYTKTDDALTNYRKLTEERTHGVGAWKIDQLQAQLTRQVMNQQGIDMAKLGALESASRAEQERAIMSEVDRRLQMMIDASLPMAGLALDPHDPRAQQAEAVPSLSRSTPLPPLMAGGSKTDSLQAAAGRSVQDLFAEHGFAAQPPITLHVDDQGRVTLSGDRPDIADIEAALAADTATYQMIQNFGSMAAGAMLLAESDAGEAPLADTKIDFATHATAFDDMVKRYTPKTSILTYNGATLTFAGIRNSEAAKG